jgi:hypothetical protein
VLVAQIDPTDLVEVKYKDGGVAHRLVAFSVSFVPVERLGQRFIVAELLFDPLNQAPHEAYSTGNYERLLLWPKAILGVKPYWV